MWKGQTFSYGELDGLVEKAATALSAQGVTAGLRVPVRQGRVGSCGEYMGRGSSSECLPFTALNFIDDPRGVALGE